MIIIKNNLIRDELPFEYVIEGHAGYAESGKDIVCSAVSMMHYAFISYLEAQGIAYECVDDGKVVGVSVSDKRAMDCFLMAIGAFDGIARSYGDYVKIVYT